MVMEKIKIVITGANGFIGKNLKRRVLNSKLELIEFKGDLLKEEEVKKFFAENKDVEKVIHLAGGFYGSLDHLLACNLLTTRNLLEHSNGVIKKIVYASTGAIYGNSDKKGSKETDCLNPNTDYALTKNFAEQYIKFYCLKSSCNYVILRFPSVYGPYNDKGVIYNFLEQIKKEQSVTVKGDGTQTRDFLHVEDACESIIKAIQYSENDIFNISSSIETSINDIIDILRDKYKFIVKYEPSDNDLLNMHLDNSKSMNKLNFVPKFKKIVL
jgi:UDP-glucose 4-epimerase